MSRGSLPGSLVEIKDNICRTGNVFAAGGKERIEVYPPSLREKVRRGELKEKAETLVFMGCLPSYLDMKTVPSLLKTLEAADVKYTTLASEESCCGFPLFLLGAGKFKPHAEKLLKKIRATGARELVTPCAGCYKTFQTLYPEIGDLGMRIYHTVQYLEKLASEERLTFDQPLPNKVTYHDPCDIGRACQVFEEPRSILRPIPGVILWRWPGTQWMPAAAGEVGAFRPMLRTSLRKWRPSAFRMLLQLARMSLCRDAPRARTT